MNYPFVYHAAEPKLNFPITFVFTGYEDNYGVYTAYKDADGVLWVKTDSWHSKTPNLYSDENVRENIKSGSWVVKSSGEQVREPLKFPLTYKHRFPDTTEYVVIKEEGDTLVWLEDFPTTWSNLLSKEELQEMFDSDDAYIVSTGEEAQAKVDAILGVVKAAPVVGNLDDISNQLKVDTQPLKEAISLANQLAQAVENVNMSLESLHMILQDMGLSKGGDECCEPFCAEGF